jgi:hypothetical protein
LGTSRTITAKKVEHEEHGDDTYFLNMSVVADIGDLMPFGHSQKPLLSGEGLFFSQYQASFPSLAEDGRMLGCLPEPEG